MLREPSSSVPSKERANGDSVAKTPESSALMTKISKIFLFFSLRYARSNIVRSMRAAVILNF